MLFRKSRKNHNRIMVKNMNDNKNDSTTEERISSKPLILLTGATGYIGGRLLSLLEEKHHRVRCLARHPEHLSSRVQDTTEVYQGDVLVKSSLTVAMKDVEVAYYLVHSMGSSGGFEEEDRQAAQNFGEAAYHAGVKRIIYLGGLGDTSLDLSPHLNSRHEVGNILRESEVQVIEFRASIIIGSGSLSFEMIRALVERLPVMITPRWVSVPAQPLAINDLLQYLEAALSIKLFVNHIFEIGGKDVVSYGDIMREYAHQRGLRRFMIPVPVLTPYLSSLWLGLVTPVYARIGRKLIDSIKNPTVVQNDKAREVFKIETMGMKDAIASAMRNEDQEIAQTRWSDALSSSGHEKDWGTVRFGSRIVDSRRVKVDVTPELAFQPIRRIGGNTGWYYGNWLWRVRGWLDLLAGGVGIRRGRRHPEELHVGETVDWWRVEQYVPNQLLRLYAEMKVPGRAWLQFEVEENNQGSVIRQTAIFDPLGLWGLVYWYGLYPAHYLMFSGMLRQIAEAANREDTSER